MWLFTRRKCNKWLLRHESYKKTKEWFCLFFDLEGKTFSCSPRGFLFMFCGSFQSTQNQNFACDCTEPDFWQPERIFFLALAARKNILSGCQTYLFVHLPKILMSEAGLELTTTWLQSSNAATRPNWLAWCKELNLSYYLKTWKCFMICSAHSPPGDAQLV